MIHPNRYHLWAAFECHAFSKAEAVLRFSAEEDGMWVQWQDYATLKAEVERLRASTTLTAVPCEVYEELKAENERLRKAGDVMYKCLRVDTYSNSNRQADDALIAKEAWNAAKDGKPSA